MLIVDQDIVCGIFDSAVAWKNRERSELRTVTFYELELFPGNSGVSYVDGVQYPVERGALICAKPGQMRFSDLPIKCYFIRLFALKSEEAKLLSAFPTRGGIPPEHFDDVCDLFLKLSACYINSMEKTQKTLVINKLFYELLYLCRKLLFPIEPDNGESVAGSVTVLKAKEFIDKNFRKNCTLSSIAEQVHVSPNYLHLLFKKRLGQSPLDCVLEKRIEFAKRLIFSEEKTLLEIALESGFSSQSYFGKVFKQETGFTPAEYRKRCLMEY